MNSLREYVKELLTEAARGLTDLRKLGYYVGIKDTGNSFEIKLYNSRSKRAMDELGTISAQKYEGGEANCMGAYMINWSLVEERGWGPLLYDLAMELATSKGSGLMSDRNNVSYQAQNVWRYYMKNRGNVEQVQMDDWDDNLTPGDKSDNCDQWRAYERGIKGGTFWDSENKETPWDPYGKEVLLKSPTTKMYRWKGMSKIAALKKMGRLFNS
jgi:hypothetical protein